MTSTLIYDKQADKLAIESGSQILHLDSGDMIEVMTLGIVDTHSTSSWVATQVKRSDTGEWSLTGLFKPGEIQFGAIARTI